MTMTVFLDTQVFDLHLFDFDSPLLENFRAFASSGRINVVTTEVTCGEIEARIEEKVRESLVNLKKWLKDRSSGVLRHVGERFEVLFLKHKAEELAGVLKRQFQEFLKATHTQILPTGKIDGAKLMAAYFGALAPFGPGRKKEQFPDAIAIAILRDWCEQNDCVVDVVSADEDWQRACDGCKRLRHTPELKDLLSGFVPPSVTDVLVEEVMKRRGLKEVIAKCFKESSFYTSEEYWEVIDVDEVKVRIKGNSIVYAPEGLSTIEVPCEIAFEAMVRNRLPSDDVIKAEWENWNPETEAFEKKVLGLVDRTAQVSIEHDGQNPKSVQIVKVQFDQSDVVVDRRRSPRC